MLNREASSARSRPEGILEELHIREGLAIADIGSGGGYFTLAFARRTGKTGRIYAVDVKKKYLDFIRRRSERAGFENIIFVLAGETALDLPKAGLDLVFARNVFHHLHEPANYFADLYQHLKPGGRVAIIEHKKKGFGFVSLFGHHTSRDAIVSAMEKAGYSEVRSFDFLQDQTFTLFAKKEQADFKQKKFEAAGGGKATSWL
ncbi:MAG TPA: methyltransferase domain-containing protein [Nitrospirota bacterium]|nr:methyltransferase domain-containing protein [Nitrospirota bacterium]